MSRRTIPPEPPRLRLSPLSDSGRRRRRRAQLRRRRAMAVLALIAAVAVVAIAVKSAGSGGGTSGATARSASTVKPGHHHLHAREVARPLSAEAAARQRQDRAILGVLRYTPFIKSGIPRHRMIALTFDDGPSPYTDQIVRILVKYHVPATFFVVGQQLNDFASGLREELRHGFIIGDHTENHAWMSHLSVAGQYAQLHDDEVRMERVGAPTPMLFRPPYGVYDSDTLALLRRQKMLMVMWSIDPGDWRRPGTGAIVSNVLTNSRPGAIVIMHDGGGDRSQTVAALPAIINGLRKRGYQLVSVPQLVESDPPPRHEALPHLSGV